MLTNKNVLTFFMNKDQDRQFKLFAKTISKRQMLLLARKEFRFKLTIQMTIMPIMLFYFFSIKIVYAGAAFIRINIMLFLFKAQLKACP